MSSIKRIDKYRLLVPREGKMIVDALIFADERIRVEDEAVNQLKNAASIPGVYKALATPDIHTGFGVPIGAVVGLPDKIVPSAVGYDVNCGMRLMTTPLKVGDIDVKQIADSIRRDIPLGEGKKNLRLPREHLVNILKKGVKGIRDVKGEGGRIWESRNEDEEADDILHIENQGSMEGDPDAVSSRGIERGKDQLGTLGGGNHFIEIQQVVSFDPGRAAHFGIEKDQIVVMIHSGSRGLGHQIGNDYMPIAAKVAKDAVPEKSLGFFDVKSTLGKQYIGAMNAAANFAFVNRQIMAMLVRRNFRHFYGNIPMPLVYDVTHNMAKYETHQNRPLWVHRKGATRSFPPELMSGTPFQKTGQPVIIPGSMGTASYLLLGRKEAEESLYSVNHGSGRTMSRTKAAGKRKRKTGKIIKPGAITDERFRESMEGIYLVCEDKFAVREEAPDAYKDIDAVIEVVTGAGLADIVAKMRPLAVLKG